MNEDPELSPERREALETFVQQIYERAEGAEPAEADATLAQIGRFLDQWSMRHVQTYWNDNQPLRSLLVSAEYAATAAAAGGFTAAAIPTLNSMREVEPSVRFKMREDGATGASST
jgi:hypothetical protein